MKRGLVRFFLALIFFGSLVFPAFAEEFYCEVMDVQGAVTLTNESVSSQALKEGDVLKINDVVQVGANSYADLAYDRDWNNVTRVEENSKIQIRALYPTTVLLEAGGVYAKLKSLPRDSSFEVQTPTAIASVRGTEYRTTFEQGETQIYNLSDSNVYVFGLDSSGQRQASPVIIHRSEKTGVAKLGQTPLVPRPMEANELERAEHFGQGIENKVNENIARGHFGKTRPNHRNESDSENAEDPAVGPHSERKKRADHESHHEPSSQWGQSQGRGGGQRVVRTNNTQIRQTK